MNISFWLAMRDIAWTRARISSHIKLVSFINLRLARAGEPYAVALTARLPDLTWRG